MMICLNMYRVLLLVLALSQILFLINGQPYDYPMANLSTSWTNSPSAPHSVDFTDGSLVRAIILRGTFGPRFACGFFCNGTCDTYLFAIFIVQTNGVSYITSPAVGFPQVVWSANGSKPVRINATLQLTSGGDLVLQDADGTVAWSTNTSGKSVAGLNLTDMGNLVLFDRNNAKVWQSFDHPTDSLVPGQKLALGQKLTARVSETNWTQGVYSLSVTSEELFAFVDSNPPQAYYMREFGPRNDTKEPSYVRYRNGSLALFILSAEPSEPDGVISVPLASSAQYIKLGPDGHLRAYEWGRSWTVVADLLAGVVDYCRYPMVCGKYGICANGQCTCPRSRNGGRSYFNQINDRRPDLGCSEISPLECEASQNHSFVELEDTDYFTFRSDIVDTNMEGCKQGCLRNCSCKAAIFRYGSNPLSGSCQLLNQIFSLMNNEKQRTRYNSYAFVKVQSLPSTESPSRVSPKTASSEKKTGKTKILIGASLGAFFGLILIIGFGVLLWKGNDIDEDEEDNFDHIPGMPLRFSYAELKAATENFSKKLGEGGFGSVFEGTLNNGTKVAVKRLDGLGHIKKSFLAEVETIGSIHHVNLVRLIGFCAEKSHRLLVYDYMCKGSLDRWIFHKNCDFILDWQCRKKIVLDIAKGLAYLHEDCRQKIVHLDIKPQNILLDENFNAKVADFGLSKLIDRDQSQVMTTMRGTPGYLAPEWLSSVITEKVDVYSFGVVIMEILCGRKNLDRLQPEEDMHLLSLFKTKAEEGQLLDMVDKSSEDMQLHGAEVVEMMKVAAWCLQSDFARRPSMSLVIKVLEGVTDVEDDLDYSFSNPPVPRATADAAHREADFGAASPLLPSVLSGPR